MKKQTFYRGAEKNGQDAIQNWREFSIGEALLYSYRDTRYRRSTYPSRLHYHDYYELVVFENGDIDYHCEADTRTLRRGDIIAIPPGRMHLSMLREDATRYTRHVFYFYPEAFAEFPALTGFLKAEMAVTALTDPEPLFTLLHQLNSAAADCSPCAPALAKGLLLQIFYLLNQGKPRQNRITLPDRAAELKRYLDEHFAEIRSVDEVAAHFFYSREYLSRLFKQHFNTSVAEYLRTRRVLFSRTLIAEGLPLTEICYRAGFGSPAAFIRAFRQITGMTPSAYKKSF